MRFGTAMAVLGIARAAGVSWGELGLGRRELGSGARTGAVAAACAAAAVLAGAAVPATRGVFLDDRATAATGRGGLAAGLARITFAAVPPEELTYRSALLGLWLADGRNTAGVAWSSALFGLSHILPTRSTMGQTALGQHLAQRPLRQAAFVAGTSRSPPPPARSSARCGCGPAACWPRCWRMRRSTARRWWRAAPRTG